MRQSRKILSLDLMEDYLPANTGSYEDEDEARKRMLRVLKEAIAGELTPRQRECVMLYYGGRKSEQEIARSLGIRTPTVCRHLKKARERLRRILEYFREG
jgi:RNA polymerase sigma factor (sigma-70 family)